MSQFLLDTQALIWYNTEPNKIPADIFDQLTDRQNQVYVGLASFWEMAIKIRKNKLDLQVDFDAFINAQTFQNDFLILPIRESHLVAIASLGKNLPHKDPFDHLLLVQASVEGFTFVSADRVVKEYPGVSLLTWKPRRK